MPARAAWKGYLRVNQLEIPVKAFSACSTQPEISLNQIHQNCGSRIQQQKRCPIHGDLTNEDIVSGYEHAEGRYLPLEPQELDSLLPEDDKTIAVDTFIDQQQVDPVYHSGRTYYVVPDGPPGQRPFCVLRDGLRSTLRHGVARIVMARRTLLVLIRPFGKLVAMTVLEYPQKVRPAAEYEGEVAPLSSSPAELDLIRKLIGSLTSPELDLHQYRDPYIDQLNSLIERKLATMADATPASSSTETDEAALIAALRASLAAVDGNAPIERISSRTQRGAADENSRDIRKPA